MDDNNLNKKTKLEHGLTETNQEGENNNRIGTSGNDAAEIDNFNHSNTSTVDVCNSQERKSTQKTLQADWWVFYQLNILIGNFPSK